MARNRSGSNKGFGNFTVVNVDFSVEDKVVISVWIEDHVSEIMDIIYHVLQTDFKVSASYSSDYECFTVSLTDKRKQPANTKAKVYMFRHGDLRKLWGIAAWYFTVQLQEGESDAALVRSDIEW